MVCLRAAAGGSEGTACSPGSKGSTVGAGWGDAGGSLGWCTPPDGQGWCSLGVGPADECWLLWHGEESSPDVGGWHFLGTCGLPVNRPGGRSPGHRAGDNSRVLLLLLPQQAEV